MELIGRGVAVRQCYRSNPNGEYFCGQSETVLYWEARVALMSSAIQSRAVNPCTKVFVLSQCLPDPQPN
jgi:hypothetical protein